MNKTSSKDLRRKTPAGVQLPDGGVRVLESHHAADFEMPIGSWPFHKVCWVAIGRGVLESDAGRTVIEGDDLLLLPAKWPHRFIDHPGQPLTLVILCISNRFFGDAPARQANDLWWRALKLFPPGTPLCARSAFYGSAMVEQFRLALREQGQKELGWETALEAVVDRMLTYLARNYFVVRSEHRESAQRTLEDATTYIQAHCYEPLQISDIAQRCRISPRRFTDLFKQHTGQTFNQYLNQERIRYACRRLDETGHILYACHESGFNDLAYFYRVFKKQTGQTPGAYLTDTF